MLCQMVPIGHLAVMNGGAVNERGLGRSCLIAMAIKNGPRRAVGIHGNMQRLEDHATEEEAQCHGHGDGGDARDKEGVVEHGLADPG